MYHVNNAIIMAAGTSSRFAPLSFERHKGLTEVRGDILIERQIRQLREAGIDEIIVVTGYKAEQFQYLQGKFGVKLIHNPDYLTRNNNASIRVVREYLANSYICSVDNYFMINPFEAVVDDSYYAAIYAKGSTQEWCMTEGADGYINAVQIGGHDSWYMMGHTFWNAEFAQKFLAILDAIYDQPETANLLWEGIYKEHLDELKMKIRKYPSESIFEFDTLDELRKFDESYVDHSRSRILGRVAEQFGVREGEIVELMTQKSVDNAVSGFSFRVKGERYACSYQDMKITQI